MLVHVCTCTVSRIWIKLWLSEHYLWYVLYRSGVVKLTQLLHVEKYDDDHEEEEEYKSRQVEIKIIKYNGREHTYVEAVRWYVYFLCVDGGKFSHFLPYCT